MGHPPAHGHEIHHPGPVHTGLPGGGRHYHGQPPNANTTLTPEHSGEWATGPRHNATNTTPHPAPILNPTRRNRILMGHSRQIPPPSTYLSHNGTLNGPECPKVRVRGPPTHPHLAELHTQRDT